MTCRTIWSSAAFVCILAPPCTQSVSRAMSGVNSKISPRNSAAESPKPKPIGLQTMDARGSLSMEPKKATSQTGSSGRATSQTSSSGGTSAKHAKESDKEVTHVRVGSAREAVALIEKRLAETVPPPRPPGSPPGYTGPPPPPFDVLGKRQRGGGDSPASKSASSQPSGSSATPSSGASDWELVLKADQDPLWPLTRCGTCPTVRNWKKMFSSKIEEETEERRSSSVNRLARFTHK